MAAKRSGVSLVPNIAIANSSVVFSMRHGFTASSAATTAHDVLCRADTYFESIKRGFFVSRGCFLSTLHV